MTGSTVAEAKDAALGQLGIGEGDAEVVVLSEGRTGLFGRVREEARVRARVRPVGPRPKRTRRTRGRRPPSGRAVSSDPTGASENGDGRAGSAAGSEGGGTGTAARSSRRRRSRTRPRASTADDERRSGTQVMQKDGDTEKSGSREGAEVAHEIPLEEQGQAAQTFLEGLLRSFGYEPAVRMHIVDEDTVEVAANGEEMGVLIGPRGTTLAALQEVTRTAVQRQFPARTDRILVDVAGYRQRRVAALQRFTKKIADEVLGSGEEQALEPMSPADRKVVHDAANSTDGIATRSEGEEPSRYVVISRTN